MNLEEIKDTLPSTLHGLLKVALDDFEVVSKKKNHVINMKRWFCLDQSEENEACITCLAGAVMHRSLGGYELAQDNLSWKRWYGTFKVGITPTSLKDSLYYKMHAIDYLRLGYVRSAYENIHELNDKVKKVITDFEKRKISYGEFMDHEDFENPKKSIKFYRKLQKELKQAGL